MRSALSGVYDRRERGLDERWAEPTTRRRDRSPRTSVAAVDGLPVEEPEMMAATTAPLALRATTGRVVFIALIAAIIVIVCSVRSSLREGGNDGQSEDDRSNEDGLAKNLASRRVCKL